MKKRNKILAVAIAVLSVLSLTACGGKEQQATYETEQNGVKIALTYYAKGDKVTKQTAESTIPYSSLGVDNEADAKELLKDTAQAYEGIAGVSDELVYGENEVTEKFEIDYTKADIEEIKGLPGVTLDGNTSKGISFKKSTKMLEDQGYTKK
jgi:uncharacterized lipoprotein YehR (DUF1307 family)